jgi:hypothetical protein
LWGWGETEGDGEGFNGGFDFGQLVFIVGEVADELEDVGNFRGGAGTDLGHFDSALKGIVEWLGCEEIGMAVKFRILNREFVIRR